MASFGTVDGLAPHFPGPAFRRAFAYAAEALRPGSPVHGRLLAQAPGTVDRVELGDGVFAMEQTYEAKPRSEGFFESHRRHIDVQVVVAGVEAMEVADIGRLRVTAGFDAERDLVKYGTDITDASRLVVAAGEAAVFFPDDGHMPSLRVDGRPALVRKTVVKVPVA